MQKNDQELQSVNNRVVLFDGVCNLCNRFVQFIIRRDKSGRIKFCQLQSETGQKLLEPYAVETAKVDSVIYLREGKIYTRSAAGLNILRDLGGVWKLSVVLFVFPKFIRDFVYDMIAKYRYKVFGKRESCMVPDESFMDRFL